tara:strand:+ start:136 stop:1116 length:981 start_codon:yes stop_codon:yes gene_type:complete
MRAMMVGPEGTPYYGGAYFFDINFPNTYPLQPPNVITITQGNGTRFNPNLYTCGKVCLSMLNTWSGPGWTPCNTIESVLLSIQAMVLIAEPLKNEPGYETAAKATINAYTSIIRYENIRVSIINMVNNPPSGFEVFKDDYLKEYVNRYSKIMEIVNTYSKKQDGKVINSTYGMSREIKYKSYIDILMKIYDDATKLELIKNIDEKEDKNIVKSVNIDSEPNNIDLITTEYINKMSDMGYEVKIDDSEEIDDLYEWFSQGKHTVTDKNQAKEHLQSINLYKQKLNELRAICDTYTIPTKKKSNKSGKMIWKLKKELIDDISFLVKHL